MHSYDFLQHMIHYAMLIQREFAGFAESMIFEKLRILGIGDNDTLASDALSKVPWQFVTRLCAVCGANGPQRSARMLAGTRPSLGYILCFQHITFSGSLKKTRDSWDSGTDGRGAVVSGQWGQKPWMGGFREQG